MSKVFLPLCSLPKIATRDGYVGATARLLLPFYSFGYWFASGQQYTFPGATIAQDTSRTLIGTHKVDTYTKDGNCPS
jgi:hypothetical protein